ncbi:putative Ig domain-containing protein [Chiayiivirga flava]|uniref:Dystroglycan-type cadherin-like domain-containing protein n=1 Tax=Chiayiivirga flava TaxID=659595 RepID=A0A7W8D5Y2_9GAMM|nr:putative Ig domain-containing protein [Chiayiivirga flava]MBB5206853.1 hypothetical protein [Chiayiivirga flava]
MQPTSPVRPRLPQPGRLLPRLVLVLGLLLSGAAVAGTCELGEGRWGGGPPQDAERWLGGGEDLLLVGAGAELVVFDLATPTTPVELGRAVLSHPAVSVAVSADGQLAAVSDWFDNVTLLDIGNRAAPTARGSYAWAGLEQPTGMAFSGNHLYVAVRTIGLAVLDIGDPDAPAFVANSDGTPTDFVFDVALHGNHAYLGQGADGVQIVDIGDPTHPTVVGNVAAWTDAGQIDIVGNRAYVARGGSGVGILDLSNPVAPAQLGTFGTDGYAYETAVLPGDRLAVANGFNGTKIFDIANPALAVELGAFGNNPYRLVPLGDRIFSVHPFASRISLVDVQTPATPTTLANIDFAGQSHAVSAGNDHVLVANGSGGAIMLDTTNPVQPTYVGRVMLDAQRVAHVNGHGVVSAGYSSAVDVIDPQPTGPAIVASIDNQFQTNDLVGADNRLYIASGEAGGLRIYDMSNPLLPQFEGAVSVPGQTVWQIAVAGDFAYSGYILADEMLVMDVSDPAAPVVIGTHQLPPSIYAGPTDMAASGNTVFVATQVNGVRILQHDGAGNLDDIGAIDLGLASPTGVSVDGDRLYIAGGVFSGLLIYDVSDPANPQFVAQYNTAGDGLAVHAAHGVIAIAEGDSGVSTIGCGFNVENAAPVAVGQINDQVDDAGETIFPLSVHPNFDDPDGQALTYSATGLPPGLAIGAGSGVISGTLSGGSAGVYPVVVTATDPFDLSATQAFEWTVNGAPEIFTDGFE